MKTDYLFRTAGAMKLDLGEQHAFVDGTGKFLEQEGVDGKSEGCEYVRQKGVETKGKNRDVDGKNDRFESRVPSTALECRSTCEYGP